jgi:hypothetical protein
MFFFALSSYFCQSKSSINKKHTLCIHIIKIFIFKYQIKYNHQAQKKKHAGNIKENISSLQKCKKITSNQNREFTLHT